MSNLNSSKMANKTWFGGILVIAFAYGSYMTLSNYLVPFSERTGTSVGEIALLFTFAGLATLVISLFLGKFVKLMKVRTLVFISAIFISFLYLALGFSDSLIVLYIAAVFYGTAMVFTGYGLQQIQIIWWFPPNQIGRRLTALTVGPAVMALIQSPLIAKSILEFGLQTTAVLHAVISVAAIVVIARVFLLEHPDSYGIKIVNNNKEIENSSENKPIINRKALPLMFVLGTLPFWLLTIASLIESFSFTGYVNNASPFYQSFGLDPIQAAFCISIVSIGQAITAPIFGFLVDKIGLAKSVAIFGTIVSATFLFSRFITNYQTAIIFAVFASAFAFVAFIAPVGFRLMYPNSDVGTLVGYANAASQVGTMLGAPIAGFIFVSTGSYVPFMTAASVLLMLCIVLVFIATGKKAKYKIDVAVDGLAQKEIEKSVSVKL